MSAARDVVEEPTPAQRAGRFVVAALTENWGTKILAFVLALMVFIATRDEITRSFTIPLRVLDDPDRVLLTQPPESVELRVRGPWANVNRLSATQLGSATLDLREARPGPMVLDPASIVMPEGVVLDTLDYAPVDLRFDALIDRALEIVPIVVGEVDDDHTLASLRVHPNVWTVRGPESEFSEGLQLQTVAVDVGGATATIDERVEIESPNDKLSFLGASEGVRPSVRLVAEVVPVAGELELDVGLDVALREAVPEFAEIELPAAEHVVVRGPRKLLRSLEGLSNPLRATVEVERPRTRGAAIPVTVRFEWSAEVLPSTAEQLTVTPPFVRLRLSPGGVESD